MTTMTSKLDEDWPPRVGEAIELTSPLTSMATQKDFSVIDSKHSISGRNFKFKFNTGNGARLLRATAAKDCVGFAKGVFSGLPWAVEEAGRGLRTARQTSEVNGLHHRLSNSSQRPEECSRNADNTNAH
jgi:hypothetical protein